MEEAGIECRIVKGTADLQWDEDGWVKPLLYRLMEATGLSTF